MSNFVSEYAAGRTPLPCAHCNGDLKFATLAERARAFGADAVATGHYARVERDERRAHRLLKRGVDLAKDQSYFLFSLTQEQLARARVSGRRSPKDAVREYARQRGLPVADKPDSQEICFIPDNDYASFVAGRAGSDAHAGDDSSTSRGACSAGTRASTGSPSASARASASHRRPALPSTCCRSRRPSGQWSSDRSDRSSARPLTASGVNWIVEEPDGAASRHGPDSASAHAGRRPPYARCDRVAPRSSSTRPQIAITPGQAAVFYEGDTVVGGGWIDNGDC